MQSPRVSVVIPVYNSESYLNECLDSLCNQTFTDFEAIIVDDGSTDSSVQIIETYVAKHQNFKLIRQKNQYAGVARNNGLDNAHGEYVTFLDSDDTLESNAIEVLYQKAVDTGAEVVRATGYETDEFGDRRNVGWALKRSMVADGSVFSWKDMPQEIFQISAGNPWGMLVKRELVQKHNIRFLDVPRTEDIYFVYDAYLKANKIAIIHDELVFHRPSEGGMEKTKVNFPLVPLEARHRLLDKVKKEGYYEDVYIGFWIAGFRSYMQMIQLLIESDSGAEYVKRYYDDIKDVILEHPDLNICRDSIYYKHVSDFYQQYRKVVESKSFDSYYNSEMEIIEEKRSLIKHREEQISRNRVFKVEDDEKRLAIAKASHIPKVEEDILFSVVIPVYNASKYLRECLDHLINQSYTNIEIICVDDGSTDDSREIVQSYPSIKLICQQNSGAGIARNRGFKESKGEYVLFMDGDDWADYSLFMKVFESIKKSPVMLDMVMYSYTRFDESTAEFKECRDLPEGISNLRSNVTTDPDLLISNDLVIPWNKVMRSEFIREHRLEFPDFKCSNDRPFYLASLVYAKEILVIEDVLINYRVNSKSVTSQTRLDHFECHYKTYAIVESDYRSLGAEINDIFIDTTISDMVHFYDVANRQQRDTIGRQICRYTESMDLEDMKGIENHWWFKKIVKMRLDYDLPIEDWMLSAVIPNADRDMLVRIGELYLSRGENDEYLANAIGCFMLAADMGVQRARDELAKYYGHNDKADAEICKVLADSGNRSAQYRLGRMYRDGRGVPKDVDKAKTCLENAVERGHNGSKLDLVELLYTSGTDDELKKAYEVCLELASKGNKDAQFRLSRMYLHGKGTAKNEDESIRWLEEAAKNGHNGARKELNARNRSATQERPAMTKKEEKEYLESLKDIGSEEAFRSIINYCNDAVERGDPIAAYYLSKAYREGRGVEKDIDKANEYLRMASEGGYDGADNELFDALWKIGTTESFNELLTLASRKAYKGDAKSMQMIGRAYRDGNGVSRNLKKSAEWMQKAYYIKDYWVNEYINVLWEIHDEESLQEMRSICEEEYFKGNAVAIRLLARLHVEEGNKEKAKEMYRKALYNNPGLVVFEYTSMLYNEGNPEDLEECLRICNDFSRMGNKDALYRLGKMYAEGKGVEADREKAKEYLTKASEAGSNLAADELRNLNSKPPKSKWASSIRGKLKF